MDSDDSNPTDDSKNAPKLRIVKGKKRPSQAGANRIPNGATVSRDLYDAMAAWWLQSDRTTAGLARQFKISIPTATKVVNRGYPQKNWAPLKERARLHDLAKEQAETKAAVHAAKVAVDTRLKARSERHGILRLAKAGYAAMFKAWVADTATAVFTEGKAPPQATAAQQVQAGLSAPAGQVPAAYPDGGQLALHGARLMAGFRAFTDMEEAVLEQLGESEGAGDEQSAVPGIPVGLVGLTPEQLDHVAATGHLPDGLSEEQVFGIRPGKG